MSDDDVDLSRIRRHAVVGCFATEAFNAGVIKTAIGRAHAVLSSLVDMNDKGKSFEEIAMVIEKYSDELRNGNMQSSGRRCCSATMTCRWPAA